MRIYITPSPKTLSALASVSAMLSDVSLEVCFTSDATRDGNGYHGDYKRHDAIGDGASVQIGTDEAGRAIIEARQTALESIPGVRVYVMPRATFVGISC